MKKIFYFLLLTLPLGANEADLKERIAACEERLTENEAEKGELHYQLALHYFQDQEVDKAFQHFLLALKETTVKISSKMSSEEKKLYDSALADYLEGGRSDPVRSAQLLLEKYGEADRDWVHLNFLLATAYANLGEYDAFFERFYRGFPYLGESFLAYKTQGVLYLRLAQHSSSSQEKHAFHEEALHYLTSALERNENDSGLYKVLIFLAKDEKNDALVLNYLQKMVERRAHIARGDIYLYVREAVLLGEEELAQEIIDLARTQYEFSRALTAAQEYLNQCRG